MSPEGKLGQPKEEFKFAEHLNQSEITADQMLENPGLVEKYYFELESWETDARRIFFPEVTEEE